VTCTLAARADGLALASPYHPEFVRAFKALLRAQDRAWDNQARVWVINPAQAQAVADLCLEYFGKRPTVPAPAAPPAPEIKVVTLEYLGQCKPRDDGEPSALGAAGGTWSLVFPESVLRAWFDPFGASLDEAQPKERQTLYGVLGVTQDASEADIKAAYKRLARQWHPDVCREPDAQEMFLQLSTARDVLTSALMRRKYDAGLAFERLAAQASAKTLHIASNSPIFMSYRAPLRCGMLVLEGVPTLGRLRVNKIFGWNDITDGAGRVMVSSWDYDAERIKVQWVQP
jgi:hypothetical protein